MRFWTLLAASCMCWCISTRTRSASRARAACTMSRWNCALASPKRRCSVCGVRLPKTMSWRIISLMSSREKRREGVGIGRGQDVVKVHILAPLGEQILMALRGVTAADAVLQRLEVGLGQVRHGACRQLGFEHLAHGVDVVDRHLLEEQVVLHELQRAIERHLGDGAATRRTGGDGDQPLHLQRLERLAGSYPLLTWNCSCSSISRGRRSPGLRFFSVIRRLTSLGHEIRALELFDRQ